MQAYKQYMVWGVIITLPYLDAVQTNKKMTKKNWGESWCGVLFIAISRSRCGRNVQHYIQQKAIWGGNKKLHTHTQTYIYVYTQVCLHK